VETNNTETRSEGDVDVDLFPRHRGIWRRAYLPKEYISPLSQSVCSIIIV